MKKSFLYSALLAAMTLTGCSESAETTQPQPSAGSGGATAVLGETPVGFDAYTIRGVTRSGLPGLLNDEALQSASGGFGVFAYYTDLKKYDQTYVPNFMYNQKVTYNSTTSLWEYSPVLYWPNEYGSDAQSDDEDKVSFFAYAPYVAATSPAAGSVADAEWGITGFSRNSTAGDPIVKYIASFDPSKSVDLCWGVSDGTAWSKIEGSSTQSMTSGKPWLDVEHPKGIDQKLKFTFKHALSQLNVQIDADPDVLDHDEDNELDSETRIYVRSISFTGIAMQGALNLNNSVANRATWLDYSGTTDLPYGQSVTVMDGRRDGREGTSGAEATNELPQGLNKQLVQSTAWGASGAPTGVTHQPQNLFQPSADADDPLTEPVYVIPTGESMTVTIVYDVETKSGNLTGYLSDGTTHGVSIENRITKNVDLSLVNGNNYTLKLHLGMNSVKFDAIVSDWVDSTTGNAWLPSNTGEGVYNALNPLSISLLNGVTNPGVSGATAVDDPSDENYNPSMENENATKMIVQGLVDGSGDPNLATISAGNASDWTMNTTGIIQIANGGAAGTRSMLAGTRADSYVWQNSLSNATTVMIKPLKAGTVKLTATDADGNASSCVIVVDADQITLDQSNITLYKFTSDSQTGTVTATLKAATLTAAGSLSEVSVVTNSYQEFTEETGTALNTSVSLTNADGATDSYKDKVVTAALNSSTGEITLTPQGIGKATVTVTSSTGATASFTVTVSLPSFNISTTAITLVSGNSKTLTYSSPKPAEDDTYSITFTNKQEDESDGSSIATYDAAKGKVTGISEGTTTLKFFYTGHDGAHDPYKECVVTVTDTDPVAMKKGEGIMETNPLYKVAQYNVDVPTFVTEEGADKGKPVATSFALQTRHSTVAQYVFSWACAKDTIDAMACAAGGSLADYHVPTWQEQVSVIPSNTANAAGTNIFGQSSTGGYFTFPQGYTLTVASASGNALVGVIDDASKILAASGVGFFYRNANNDFYAVRIIGDVATAWHYKRATYNGVMGLKIDSYVLDLSSDDITLLKATTDPVDAKFTSSDEAIARAKVILGALPDSPVWTSVAPNESETAAASTTSSYCMRFLPASGRTEASQNAQGTAVVGSGVATANVGSNGNFWSSTASSSTNAFYWTSLDGYMSENSNAQTYGFSVRLFRD